MKKLQKGGSFVRGLAVGLAVMACASVTHASPFASATTNINLNGSNYVQFIVNESGGSVSVTTYPSGATNLISANCPAGLTNFFLGSDTSYAISCTKLGNGTPFQITTDTDPNGFNIWVFPVGIDTIKNPTNGALFGRMFVGNSTPGVNSLGAFTTKGQGLYALNADCSDSYLHLGTNASFTTVFTNFVSPLGVVLSPYNLSVNPQDNTVDVSDYSSVNATIYKFDPNFNATVGAAYDYQTLYTNGQSGGLALGIHGDPQGVFTTGSVATGNLELYTFDPGFSAPGAPCVLGIGNEGQTAVGSANMLYRYDIGSGPLPWTNGPNFGVCLGLPGFYDLVGADGDVTLGPDLGTNFYYATYYRANFSDPCLQVFSAQTGDIVYSSTIVSQVSDYFAQAYDVRVSPDGLYLATINFNNVIQVVNLTNGIPDNSTIITIANTSSVSRPGGLAFDAADNIYEVSSGQGLLRGYSLGNSGVAVTSNDVTGLHGSFQLLLPSEVVTVSATTPLASQNYINSSPAGTPIPGVFTFTTTTNSNSLPVAINIALSGSATLGNQYTINSSDTNGVTYTATTITIPAGLNPAAGHPNWSANLIVTPTATPLTGPSTTVTVTMTGGGNYRAGSPKVATLSIQNTGPQFLFINAASSGTTMNRGIPNDYAQFTLTRWGDTNGPNNTTNSINPLAYTVTNITYLGSANFTNDYGAQAQRIDPTTTGTKFAHPTVGSPGIKIKPGDVSITCVVGDPVFHTNQNLIPTNVTIIVDLTNSIAPTNGATSLSAEGYPYIVTNTAITMTEIDNTKGPEFVLWSDPLTNSLENTWTLVYDATNLATHTVLPVVVPNYTNSATGIYSEPTPGTNNFRADFGNPVANDGIPPSPLMIQNGWSNALRVTVNKDNASSGAPTAINLYPPVTFGGNIALRFSMYLSTYDFYRGGIDPSGTAGREFALFGIDHYGTNANWRPTATVAAGTGNGPVNCDGIWFAIDAGSGSLTPADFDAFNSPPITNTGTVDIESSASSADNGIFKNPPFNMDMSTAGGSPANLWVDVDVEQNQASGSSNVFNITEFVDRGSVVTGFSNTNQPSNAQLVGGYNTGTIMLGYEDPVFDVSDETAFAYFSNVRVVELAPYVAVSASQIVTNGQPTVFTNTVQYVAAPGGILNVWYLGSNAPVTAVFTNTPVASTNATFLYTNISTTGTNFFAKSTDAAGSTTSAATSVEVISGPGNVVSTLGANAFFTVTASGPSAPTIYNWYMNGSKMANSGHYAGTVTASLEIKTVVAGDSGPLYVCHVTNVYGGVLTTPATIVFSSPPTGAVVAPAAQTNLWGSTATFSVTTSGGTGPFTYQWELGTTNIIGATNSSISISNLVTTNGGSYTATVSNSSGSTLSSAGLLTVQVTQPKFNLPKPVTVGGGNVTMSFSSTNSFDTSNAFILLSSPVASAPANAWTNTPGTFTGSAGSFQVVTPQSSTSNLFYQLEHVQ